MDRWATRAPNKDFMILAFNGNVAYANKLDFNIGKAILYNNATNSYTTQSFTITGNNLSPGTYDITFRNIPEPVPTIQAGAESLNGCAIDSGPISRSLTIPQPPPPPDGSTPPPDGSTPPPDGSTPPPPADDKTCEEDAQVGYAIKMMYA